MQNILMPNIYFMLKNVSAVKLKKKKHSRQLKFIKKLKRANRPYLKR